MNSQPTSGVVREILTDENPILRTPSAAIELPDEGLAADIADLAATLQDFRERVGFGRAISAPQVGIMKRLVVMNLGDGPIALINPTVDDRSDATQQVWDDCLSVPGKLVLVERAEQISMSYQTVTGEQETWTNLPPDLSELLQHEIDHLDGILMTDRVIGDAIRPIADKELLIAEQRATG